MKQKILLWKYIYGQHELRTIILPRAIQYFKGKLVVLGGAEISLCRPQLQNEKEGQRSNSMSKYSEEEKAAFRAEEDKVPLSETVKPLDFLIILLNIVFFK